MASIPRKQSEQKVRPRYKATRPRQLTFPCEAPPLKGSTAFPNSTTTWAPRSQAYESIESGHIQALHGFLPSSTKTVRQSGEGEGWQMKTELILNINPHKLNSRKHEPPIVLLFKSLLPLIVELDCHLDGI